MSDKNQNNNQRRTLWIMAAAGVFLLVVVGAAIILYSSDISKSGKNQRSGYEASSGWIVSDINSGAIPDGAYHSDTPLSPFASDYEGTSGAESADVVTLDGIGLAPQEGGPKASSSVADSVFPSDFEGSGNDANDGDTTIDLNNIVKSPSVTAQNDFTAAQIESKDRDSRPSKTASSKPASSGAKKASSAKNSASKSGALADKFWVQVGSFEDKNKADSARAILIKNKMPAEVFTIDSDGKMKYRVRVGPCTTKSEAQGWLSKIVAIEPFTNGESYVVNSNAPAVK